MNPQVVRRIILQNRSMLKKSSWSYGLWNKESVICDGWSQCDLLIVGIQRGTDRRYSSYDSPNWRRNVGSS
jgi:hypothetical protein